MASLYSASTANNARLLEPERVAQLFVPPPYFRELFSMRHQLLVGPRGSGKTTLLKMLRLPALDAWSGEDAEWARRELPFVSIFVPADVSWTGKLQSQAKQLEPPAEVAYTRAALSLLLKRSLIQCFMERCRRLGGPGSPAHAEAYTPQLLDSHGEVRLCRYLAESWSTDTATPTFRGLKTALSQQVMTLRQALTESVDTSQHSIVQTAARRVAHPIAETIINAIDIFEEVTNTDSIKWAVLFDELEITPEWLQEEALARFRSTDQRLIFKLAITPCGSSATHVGGLTQPHRVDDYEEIPLWYSETRDAMPFCEAFWRKLLEIRRLPSRSPMSVLGTSPSDDFEPRQHARSGRYATRGVWFRRIQMLALRDASFAEYLRRRGVDVRTPMDITRKQMDSVIRKVAPIAFYREYFLRGRTEGRHGRLSTRTRKVVALYSGAKSVFRITEGNPRWYLSIIGELLDLWIQHGAISRQQQAAVVAAFANRFLATVAAYPNPRAHSTGRSKFKGLTVTTLIGRLGRYGFWQIVGEQFNEDPRLSIKVDLEDPNLDSVLNVAINAGALVLVAKGGDSHFIASAKGRILRLSYQLSPMFRTPLRIGRHVGLSQVLGDVGKPSAEDEELQLGIFE